MFSEFVTHMPPLHTLFFAGSLLALATFFALKEREVYSGSRTLPTRVLAQFSPVAERMWHAVLAIVLTHTHRIAVIITSAVARVFVRIGVTIRYLIVVLAEKMIKGVKGERFLSMRGAPSVYLKRLKDEVDGGEK